MVNLDITRYYEIFSSMSEEELGRVGLVSGNERYTYAQLDEAVRICASDLIDKGVSEGDHVALWSFNCANSVIAQLAIIRIGAVAVLGNYSMSVDETAELFEMTDSKYLVYGSVLASVKDAEAIEKIKKSLRLDDTHLIDITASRLSYKDRLGEPVKNQDEIKAREERDDGQRDAFIIFTTGTTSKPKAVLDHQLGMLANLKENVINRQSVLGDKAVVSLPLFHVFGLCMMFTYFLTRKTVYLPEKVGAQGVVDLVKEHEITDICTVTAVHLGVVDHPDFDQIQDRINLLITAGGALTPVQFMKLETAYDHARLFNEYGQTETHGFITSANADAPLEKRAYTIGKPYHPEEVKIYDREKGFLPDGEIGEIVVKNKTIMNGYYKLPADKQSVDETTGWLFTGDLGYIDPDGYFKLAGRSKDIIIKNGENVSPREIEDAISELDGIREVKVFGAPHPIYGESIECCIVTEGNAEPDEKQMKTALKGRLAAAKIPSNFYRYDSFPLAPSGKLDQRGLRLRMLRSLRERIVHSDLEKGVRVLEMKLTNTSYIITPVVSMLRQLVENMKYSAKRSQGLALAVEEFLTERIVNAFEEIGDVYIHVYLEKEWLRIVFADHGERYDIQKNKETSMCARIILKYVDQFKVKTLEDGGNLYAMDFLYEADFDIEKFILSHDKEIQ